VVWTENQFTLSGHANKSMVLYFVVGPGVKG